MVNGTGQAAEPHPASTAGGPSLTADVGVRRGEEAAQTRTRVLRGDIQVLRAIAILLVLCHHARLPVFPGGFLGVDIFFVISGYLMTGLIDEGLDNGRFSFASFYARRIRRLLPAAYATLAVTAIAAPFLLDSAEYAAFVRQLAGAFGFVANIVLWRQSDYFSSGAELKPLLHMWSLALEEQFYLVLPLALALLPRRFRLAAAVALTISSLALCFYLVGISPSATFYMLPTRAWELGIGVAVALLVRRGLVMPRAMPAARLACLAILLAVPLLVDETGHPGFAALIVCAATALLVVPGWRGGDGAWLRPVRLIGDRSYSLYLVHWPLFAFANNIFIAPVPRAVNIALLLGAVVWTELQYRLVEQRARRFRFSIVSIALLLAVPLVAIGASWIVARDRTTPLTAARAGNAGFSRQCDFRADYLAVPACQNMAAPKTLVWGDSFAMHLVDGLAASSPGGVAQATKTACGPFLDLAPMNDVLRTRQWAQQCIAFNRSVMASLARQPSNSVVVLSSPLTLYLPGTDKGYRSLALTKDGFVEQAQSAATLEAALDRTVAAIRATGRRVVLFAPPPSNGLDMSRCQLRAAEGLPTIAPGGGCGFTRAEMAAERAPVLGFLDTVRKDGRVPVVSFDDVLCAGGTCATRIGPVILYADHGHLNAAGSRLIGRRMDWGGLAMRAAR